MAESYLINFYPFKTFDCYLTASYIIVRYSHYSIQTLKEMIDNFTNSVIEISIIENLRTKLFRYPDLYGKNFFVSQNLDERIENFLKIEPCVNFETEALFCEFCKNRLKTNGRIYKAECYFYSKKPCQATIKSKICCNCSAEHFLSYAQIDLLNVSKGKIFKNALSGIYIDCYDS